MKKYILYIFMVNMCVLYAQENSVIIGANSIDENSKSTLDIRGDLKIDKPDLYDGSKNDITYPLFIKNSQIAGEKKISISHLDEEKSINVFFLKLRIQKPGSDLIKSYNTGIRSSKYLLFRTTANLFEEETNTPAIIKEHESWNKGISLSQVIIFEQGGFWHIRADYRGSAPLNNSKKHYWKVGLVAINLNQIKKINIIPSALQSSYGDRSSFKLNTDSSGGLEDNPLK